MRAKQWVVAAVLALMTATGTAFAEEPAQPKAEDHAALIQRLKDGNARFVAGKTEAATFTAADFAESAKGQAPFAMVLSCADSRVPVERIFDQGIGDLFVLRVAGNKATSEIEGSLEFGHAALKSNVLLVLGHSACGAIKGAEGWDKADRKAYPKHLRKLLANLSDDLKEAREEAAEEGWQESDPVALNVLYQIDELKDNKVIGNAVEEGKLTILGGVYDLATGTVRFIDDLEATEK